MSTTDDFEWNVIYESRLLDAMHGHKPVGVNKYFQMAFICDKFTDNISKDVDPERVWAHLATMYNLEALDEGESIPFPNSEKDFDLPETEFGTLITRRSEEDGRVRTSQPPQQAQQTPQPPQQRTGGRETARTQPREREREREATKAHEDKDKSQNHGRAAKESGGKERRDSRDSGKSSGSGSKKDGSGAGRVSTPTPAAPSRRDTPTSGAGRGKGRSRDDGRHNQQHGKRPTRGSLRPEDTAPGGKSSPVGTTSSLTSSSGTPAIAGKRRRVL